MMAVRKLLLVMCMLFWSLPAISAETGPAAPVEKLNGALLQAMRGGEELGTEGRYRLLAPVIEQVFALPIMARTAVGRFWRDMDSGQKESYLRKYRQWTITSYASRFDSYGGQKFKVQGSSNPVDRAADVVSIFTTADGEQIPFNYRVLQTDGGWQIADVRVQGVSQLALTRSQFVNILRRKGFDGLMAMLEEKIVSMSAGGKAGLTPGSGP